MDKQSFKEGKYKYIKYLGNKEHLLLDLSVGINYPYRYEVWFSNKNHANYGLIYKNTHLEFARSLHLNTKQEKENHFVAR